MKNNVTFRSSVFGASTRRASVAALATAVSLGMAACGGDDDPGAATTSAVAGSGGSGASASAAADTADQGALVLEDGYVGAKDAETSMTAVFGMVRNTTDKDIHLTRVTGSLPGVYQYHEVVDGVMGETDDGIVVPAGGGVRMEPGGYHIMIMGNHDDIAAGDELDLTLTAEDGTTYEVTGVPVRVQQSGHEDYGTEGMEGMDGMDGMEGMDSTDGGADSSTGSTAGSAQATDHQGH